MAMIVSLKCKANRPMQWDTKKKVYIHPDDFSTCKHGWKETIKR